MSNTELKNILSEAFCEQMKQELSRLPSDEELRERFPVTEEKRERFIKRVYKKKKPTYMLYLRRVAVAALAVITASFGMLMTNDDIRAGVLEKGVKLFDEYVQFDFSFNKDNVIITSEDIKLTYIPDGYTLVDDSFGDLVYESEDMKQFHISVIELNENSNGNISISDEFKVFKDITINGFDGYYSYNHEEGHGIIVWGNSLFQILISGELSENELLKIAKNIDYK